MNRNFIAPLMGLTIAHACNMHSKDQVFNRKYWCRLAFTYLVAVSLLFAHEWFYPYDK